MKRRDLLRKTGTGFAITVGVTGVGSATDTFDPRGHVAAQEGLLADLAADGVIDSADVDEFDLQTLAAPTDDADGVVATTLTVQGTETDALVASKEVEEGTLELFVVPEHDGSFAVVRDGDEVKAGYDADVEPEDHCSIDCPSCYDGNCYHTDDFDCSCYCYCICKYCPE